MLLNSGRMLEILSMASDGWEIFPWRETMPEILLQL